MTFLQAIGAWLRSCLPGPEFSQVIVQTLRQGGDDPLSAPAGGEPMGLSEGAGCAG